MSAMDRQILIERLLEVANLTDWLEDEAAKSLLKWAVSQVDRLMAGSGDDEAVNRKLQGLMKVVKRINSLAGNPQNASNESVADLLIRYEQAFGASRVADASDRAALIGALSSMQPKEAVVYLIDWLQKETDN
jgi:hypothetical protein